MLDTPQKPKPSDNGWFILRAVQKAQKKRQPIILTDAIKKLARPLTEIEIKIVGEYIRRQFWEERKSGTIRTYRDEAFEEMAHGIYTGNAEPMATRFHEDLELFLIFCESSKVTENFRRTKRLRQYHPDDAELNRKWFSLLKLAMPWGTGVDPNWGPLYAAFGYLRTTEFLWDSLRDYFFRSHQDALGTEFWKLLDDHSEEKAIAHLALNNLQKQGGIPRWHYGGKTEESFARECRNQQKIIAKRREGLEKTPIKSIATFPEKSAPDLTQNATSRGMVTAHKFRSRR